MLLHQYIIQVLIRADDDTADLLRDLGDPLREATSAVSKKLMPPATAALNTCVRSSYRGKSGSH